MKRLLLPLLIILTNVSVADNVEYKLSWIGDGIMVKMTLLNADDSLTLDYGDENAGGLTEQINWLKDISSTIGNVYVDSLHHSFLVLPSDGRAEILYTVKCRIPDVSEFKTCIRDMFTPDIDQNMLYVQGFNLFLKPRGKSDMKCDVVWEDVPSYPVFCLYNPAQGTKPFSGTVDEICSSVIVGDPLLSVDTVMIEGKPNYLVSAFRKSRAYNKEALVKFMRQLYGSATSFWKDTMAEPYSLVLFPFRGNRFEVSGNGYRNGFLSRYDATCDTVLNNARRDVFVHELGHKWIDDGPTWFCEGFNEMQTAYQIVASGLDAPEYFATYLNHALDGYHKNPHRNEPDSIASERFWDDGQYIWLLYWRGFSYAFYLAGEIEHHTGKKNAYKIMMDALKSDIDGMDSNKFLEDLENVLNKEVLYDSFKKYILEGQCIDYEKAHLPSGCELYYNDDGAPQIRVTDKSLFAEHFSLQCRDAR